MKRFISATVVTVIAITAVAFTACNKGSGTQQQAQASEQAQAEFTLYGVWRYVSSADVERGETWVSEEKKTISFFKDGENVYYTSSTLENSILQGALNDMGDFRYTFTPHTRFNLDTKAFSAFEVQGPPTAWLVVRYDSENKRLVSADHTVEQYYEWAGESSLPDISAFTSVAQVSAPSSSGYVEADLVHTWRFESGSHLLFFQSDKTFELITAGSVVKLYHVNEDGSYNNIREGTWSLANGNNLLIEGEKGMGGGTPSFGFTFTITGDALTLKDDHDNTAVFRRVEFRG